MGEHYAFERLILCLTISLTYRGHGIPTAITENMMHPFYSTKEIGKRTGLGLSISKGIAEDHMGRLYLDTSARNTRFIVELASNVQPA